MAKYRFTHIVAFLVISAALSPVHALDDISIHTDSKLEAVSEDAVTMARVRVARLIEGLDEVALAIGYFGEGATLDFGSRFYRAEVLVNDPHATIQQLEIVEKDLTTLRQELGL